jgi:hypothetical protein
MILWLFKMSRTSEDIYPTAITAALPIMPSNGRGGNGNSTNHDLEEFVKILVQSNACSRKYCEKTKILTLFFYDKTHTGCQVIIYLTRCRITIIDFLHLNILKNDDYTFNPTGFKQYVMPFLTPAEVEKQKRFDELELEQKRLMAEQQKIREQEKKVQDDALIKAHLSRTCGGSNTCTICQHNKKNQSLNSMWTSRFPQFTGT